MKPFLRRADWLVLLLLANISAANSRAVNPESDTTDPLPAWELEPLYDSVTRRFCDRYKLFMSSGGLLDVENGQVIYTLPIDVQFSPVTQEQDSACLLETKSVMLAWQRRAIGDSIRINTALFWCEGVPSNGGKKKRWALAVFDQIETEHTWSWRISSGREGFNYYDHPPANEDIYALLDSLRIIESRMFTSNPYDWQGVSVEFVDGDVREKTWEAVIGEKPTRFFPNGK